MQKGQGASRPSYRWATLFSSSGVHQLGTSPNPILLSFYGGFITKAWLIPGEEGPKPNFPAKGGCLALRTIVRTCELAIDDKVTSSPSPHSRGLGVRLKMSILWSYDWLHGNHPLFLSTLQKPPHSHNKRHPYLPHSLGNSKTVRRKGEKDQKIYLFLHVGHISQYTFSSIASQS